jgi:hypothetical protein
MRTMQVLFGLGVCAAAMWWLGALYLVLSVFTVFAVLAAGVWLHGWHRLDDLAISVVAGLLWPWFVAGFVLYQSDSATTPTRTGTG